MPEAVPKGAAFFCLLIFIMVLAYYYQHMITRTNEKEAPYGMV